MKTMQRLRSYHATLVFLAVLAYLTGEIGLIHAWLGYGVATVIVLRLAWATAGVSQLGLSRFYPLFEGLKLGNAFTHPAISRTFMLGIALCLIAVTLTGISMDNGKSIGMGAIEATSTALAADASSAANLDDDDDHDRNGEDEGEEGLLGEVHEFFANLLMLMVGLHVSYVLLFKRPLAKFMLYLDTPRAN